MKKISLLFIFALALLIPATGCFAGGPWRGKVIEDGTKKPIEGAVVVAVWYSETTLNPAGSSRDPMKVVETVTNANGEFEFSSKYFVDLPVLREVSGPNFLIYKPGYEAGGRATITNEKRYFEEETDIIELPRLEKKEDREKAYEGAKFFHLRFESKTPKLNAFIKDERKYLGFGD